MVKGIKTTNREAVEEVPYGMYVWQNPDGEIFGDDDGNVMNVFCMKGDREAIRALAEAAKYYGAGEGKPVWWSGKRRITDEELEYQQMRERMGLIPDPLDYGAQRDAAIADHVNRNRND
jgi:hypothetical protein